ncbi:TIGR02587 family membrane protein [Oscillatoriales cyanobacterium LEGE 11467]|uniref:TIGR02587 family membrane protein n=1 Tax=Zarconia navalis LEGE 11467 TaxID=1828826 RepID=A0A928Z7U8_9CYAN|nr:TIGR02587 family membrane protein [Zarconia navalis]MBE9041797.1 TIGR02587 family membrane protein [Zarconia navalis LEGE 11467]
MAQPQRPYGNNIWLNELSELVGGASGGFLFGIPLIYTLEVWWIGSQVSPPILLCILTLTLGVVFSLNCVEGFRASRPSRAIDIIQESVEALAIGLTCATLMLILLSRITSQTPLTESLGKIVFESVPFSLGVALSKLILSGEPGWEKAQKRSPSKDDGSNRSAASSQTPAGTLADLSTTLFGAVIIAFSIAPTDEVPVLAAASSPPKLLAIVAASLIVSYGIVFVAGFTNQSKRQQQQGIFQSPQNETLVSYILSLLASALMLWFFQQLSWDDPWYLWLCYTIVLGLPATIGGAAGRLAV